MLQDYDPSWPERFLAVAGELKRRQDPEWVVEHIGSTAVPGLAAKPIIDLAVRVDSDADFERHRPGLEECGWRLGSGVRSHRVMLLETDGVRTAIAHFFERDAWEQVNQRIFRDWLIAHPDDALAYARVEREAAEAATSGQARYSAGKTAYVQEVVDRARLRRGLPLVSVSDK